MEFAVAGLAPPFPVASLRAQQMMNSSHLPVIFKELQKEM